MKMRGYGQFCPIAKASEVLGERWTNLIVRELLAGSHTFIDVRKGIPLISPSLLSSRLKSLERSGIVERKVSDDGITYHLTQAGQELKPIIMQLGVWGQRWVRSNLDRDDLDPSLLMWDIHRTMDATYFTRPRTVLKFEFAEYTSKFRLWWLVVSHGDVDVCLRDPGYEVDLHIMTSLRTMTAIWMGDMGLGHALRNKLLKVHGSTDLKNGMPKWLRTNYYANIKAVTQVK